MINRIVKLTLKKEHIETFPRLFEIIKDDVSNFQGCHGVQLLQDVHDENTFFTYSLWDKEEDLMNYKSSAFFGKTWKTMKAMFDGQAQVWSTQMLGKSKKQW